MTEEILTFSILSSVAYSKQSSSYKSYIHYYKTLTMFKQTELPHNKKKGSGDNL